MEQVKTENERIRKTVKPSGNGAIAYCPKNWIGEEVLIIRLEGGEKEMKIPHREVKEKRNPRDRVTHYEIEGDECKNWRLKNIIHKGKNDDIVEFIRSGGKTKIIATDIFKENDGDWREIKPTEIQTIFGQPIFANKVWKKGKSGNVVYIQNVVKHENGKSKEIWRLVRNTPDFKDHGFAENPTFSMIELQDRETAIKKAREFMKNH